ncbi:MAG: hypothetical protein A3J74_08190 [Elusimicrobia bacterium RIFCSPHIGHO2_02_FULL_57_9]|nr:MAG: hypothetical protein A3J74_08190 [Elusimicrobia bacterium RIFCSPHIGHO2_02_FULL_57_9]
MVPLDFPEDNAITEINMTPLVDVSLVLVIIFMVVVPFFSHIIKPMTLPSASRAAMTERNSISVSVFPDGDLAVGSSLIAGPEQLVGAIAQEIASGKAPWVMVRAGNDVAHGRVMDIIKTIKKAKIERVGFAVQPKASAEGVLP